MAPQKSKNNKDPKKKLTLLRPFRFTGERLDFLNERVAYFHVACDTNRIRPFWSILMHDYWTRFHWRLPAHVNPYDGMDESQPATSQEIDEKVIILQTQYRVKAFMWHHRTVLRRMQAMAAAHAEPVPGAPALPSPLVDAVLGNEMYLVEQHVVVEPETA
ncbi:hypothetical protein C8R47DRAFT_1212041 [Mycena vitilis]|nr:hypothetical protein C8R47DRAFT_1212041 [Mycena vitilis]